MTKDRPLRLVGYVRVSTNMQADEGHSLEAQAAKLRSFCATYGHTIVAMESDPGASASTLLRPRLQAALDMCRDGRVEGIVVAKLDRLTRSVKDLGELIETGAGSKYALISVSDRLDTTTASGRLMLNVLVSVSQWERESTGERTRAVLRHLQSHGMHLGGIPFGWRRTEGSRLERDENQQRVIAGIVQQRADGSSLGAIAARLNHQRTPGAMGGQWTATSVRRVLKASAAQTA